MRRFLLSTIFAISIGTNCPAATYGFSPTQLSAPLSGFGSSLFLNFHLEVPDFVVASGFFVQDAVPNPQYIMGANGADGFLGYGLVRGSFQFDTLGNLVSGNFFVDSLDTSDSFRSSGPASFEFDFATDNPGECGSGGFATGCTGEGSFFLVPGTFSIPEPGTLALVTGMMATLAAARRWRGWAKSRQKRGVLTVNDWGRLKKAGEFDPAYLHFSICEDKAA